MWQVNYKFIKNHFHQKPFFMTNQIEREPNMIGMAKNNKVRISVKASRLMPTFRVSAGLHVEHGRRSVGVWVFRVSDFGLSGSGVVQVLLRCCSGVVQVLFRCCSGVVQVLFRCCSGAVQVLFRCCSGAVQVLFRCCSGAVQVLFRCCSGVQVFLGLGFWVSGGG